MAFARPLAAALLVVSLTSGCALAVSGPDPGRPRNEVPQCDTGKGLVAMDGLWASLSGVGALAAFSGGESGTGTVLAGVTALFLATAIRGNNAANACRGAFDEYAIANQSGQYERELIARQRVEAKPAPKKKPPKQVEPPPPPDEPRVPIEEPEQPAKQEPIAPEYTAPRPPPPPKPTKPAPKQPAAGEEDWSSFWKELP